MPISIEAVRAALTRDKVGQYHHGQPIKVEEYFEDGALE